MASFVLVHGAWHGAWCWEKVMPHLHRRGHQAVAVDLPGSDPTASFDDYANAVLAAAEGFDEPILVGHSMAGQTIPLVAAHRRVSRLVYLCATLPDVGRSLFDQMESEPGMINPEYLKGVGEPDTQNCISWIDEKIALKVLFSDCEGTTAVEAFQQLSPGALFPATQPFSLPALPSVPSTYVMCVDDNMVSPAWSRRVVGTRLHADLIEMPGGHEPFLSRPAHLAEVLHGLAVG